ncbi:hypothetical protein ACFRFL_13895 [Streptomyces sp. NPDC056708]|uniref:hypothetical protein n=1 Tax=unclassified Streptomyces TaxID=2593676 RepID=UPI0036B8029F
MSQKRKKTNKSARDKQIARQKAARQARAAEYSRWSSLPPFAPYREWVQLPEHLTGPVGALMPEQVAEVSEEAREFLDRVIELAPLYGGRLPMAALYLDMQISAGELNVALFGETDMVRQLPVGLLAASLSDQGHLDRLREENPDVELPEQVEELTTEEWGRQLHSLHALGYLILDDAHVVNLAMPPKTAGERWQINGRFVSA